MESESSQQLIAIIILLAFSAFFSASETSLTSINKLKLRNMVEEGKKGADKIEKIISNPGKLLSSILVGNNLVNIAASSLATAFAISVAGEGNSGLAISISTVVLTILILIFGEITPKTIAARMSDKVALVIYRPIQFFVVVLSPAVFILNALINGILRMFGIEAQHSGPLITEAELKTIVNVSHEEGVLEVEKREMINNVFDFGDFRARDIMTPRTDIVALPRGADYSQTMELFKNEQFSRVPVYVENADNIVGLLSFKDVAFHPQGEPFSVEKYLREVYFTYESKPVMELFGVMKSKGATLAVVLDEYGGTAGMITMEDLIEEIVGDIVDEYDEEEPMLRLIREKEYSVEPAARISDINEMLGTGLESEDYETIGGYVIGLFDRIPEKDEWIDEGVLRFTIDEVDKNRIEKLRITVLE